MSNNFGILWQSNSMTSPSGYGQQTREWLPRIKNAGYRVALHAFYGCEGSPYMSSDGILVLPRVVDAFGNDVVMGHYQYTQSDVVISLIDPHALNPEIYSQFPWCAIAPIDSTPLLPANTHALKAAKWIWAISRHGERMLHAAGFNNVTYVPHGVDTRVFAPKDRNEARHNLGKNLGFDFTGKFLVVANSANKGAPSRKGFYEMFAAFKAFSDKNDDAVLYVHTESAGAFQGENLHAIMQMLNLNPDKVIFPLQYQLVTGMIPPDYLADVYNAADVFLSTSHGEGFGIPIIEAQACGCPVIVTRGSAMTELCLTGWLINSTAYMPVVGTTWQRPHIAETINLLNAAYVDWRSNDAIRSSAREKAMIYDADVVFDKYMLPALHQIEAMICTPPEPKRILTKHRDIISVPDNLQLAGRY